MRIILEYCVKSNRANYPVGLYHRDRLVEHQKIALCQLGSHCVGRSHRADWGGRCN